jgi:hypothetical protein
MCWKTEESWFDFWQGIEIFASLNTYTCCLAHPSFCSRDYGFPFTQGRKADHSSLSNAKIKNGLLIQEQFYLYLTLSSIQTVRTIRNSIVAIPTMLWAGWPWLLIPVRAKIFLFSKTYRPNLQPTQPALRETPSDLRSHNAAELWE